MGLSTDAINRVGLPPEQSKALLDSMPIAYAVSYMFGTVGSALVIALLGPSCSADQPPGRRARITGESMGGPSNWAARLGLALWELRAYRVNDKGKADG